MKIDFNLEFIDNDDMGKIRLDIYDATHVEEVNGNKLHSFDFRTIDNNIGFTLDDEQLSTLIDVLLLRLKRND